MTSQDYNGNMVTINVSELTIHPILKDLGIESFNQFEIEVNRKFKIPNDVIIVNKQSQVICNWEYVELCQQDIIEVYQLDLNDDELTIALASKNLRKKLKPSGRITLERLLKVSLKKTEFGKDLWMILPGKSTVEKIGTMLQCSYGTIQKDFVIHTYAPQLIKEMDEGTRSLASAYEYAMQVRDKIANKEKTKAPGKDSKSKNKKSGDFAGDTKMVLCQPIAGIVVRLSDGTPYDMDFSNDKYLVESRVDPNDPTYQHHKIINQETQAVINIHIKGINKM